MRLVSMAGTGRSFNYIRPRVAQKLVLLRFDKTGKIVLLFCCTINPGCLLKADFFFVVGQKVLFVEEKKLRSIPEPESAK